MKIIVIAEHDGGSVSDSVYAAVSAAKQLANGGDIALLVLGNDCAAVADACSTISGVSKVYLVEHDALAHGIAENIAPVIARYAEDCDYLLMSQGSNARSWLPRVAAQFGVQMISDVIGIESADTFIRPIYAGNALVRVRSRDAKKILSVRMTSFEMETATQPAAEIITSNDATTSPLVQFVSERTSADERPDLTSAKIVISGGRGVGSVENFEIIKQLADKLGASVGASRAAVDAGYIGNDFQVGQTGKIVAPDAYFAIGISGAIQHIAGIKDSKVIVAINKDPDAPIFDIADYGLVGDLFEVVPALMKALD